jgi:hypothetical protein
VSFGRNSAWLILLVPALALAQAPLTSVTRVTTEPDGRIFVDGKPVFPIGFTQGPPADAKDPSGANGMAALRREGFTFQQWQCPKGKWGPAKEAELDGLIKAADREGERIVIWIGDLENVQPSDTTKYAELRRVINKYRNDPAIFLWKGVDEPQWGKIPAENLRAFHDLVHESDPNHPVWVTQAPRGTAVDYKEPVMMTLQICWSGVAKPGKTLRFPTFPDQRYMSYQAIIDGARALLYFGGTLPQCLNERDRALGWNWTFYDRVLQPVLNELSPASPLYPALIAPKSTLAVKSTGGPSIEYLVREAGSYIYLLAAKREGDTVQASFSGLPGGVTDGEVLFEAPRHVQVANGGFTDWFGPNEVHVYRFRKP